METKTKVCKNCEFEFDNSYSFCPNCGQQCKDDLTVGVLFYNTISNYFSFDARFFRSFIPLMLKPGFIARKFVEGKRLQYLHPAQFYLFVSVIFFFIFSFKIREYNTAVDKALKKGFEIEKNQSEKPLDSILKDTIDAAKYVKPIINNPAINANMTEEDKKVLDSVLDNNLKVASPKDANFNFGYNTRKLDSLIDVGATEEEQLKAMGMKEDAGYFQRTFLKQLIKFHKQQGGGIVQAISDTIPIALFFLLPFFALILKLFYWRRGRFSHHLVFSFYYFSYLFVILGLLIGINHFLFDIPDWVDFIVLMSTFLYLWLSMKRFYQQGYFLTLIKSGIIAFIYMLLIIPFSTIIITASFFFY